ncbi:uncharacterized protein [Eurosta solidaginis]|uniref:uncharacterized protein n=1 Tax=Eurosta solidaginis TaxID=178769 RepID=UPI003530935D
MAKLHKHSTKLTRLVLSFVCISLKYSHTLGYSQVLVHRNDGALDEGPKIFKALNMDLIYPRTFNSSTSYRFNATARTPITTAAKTGSTVKNIKESQQHHGFPAAQQTRPMAAEYSIIYVTPAADDGLQLTTYKYENNIKASTSPTTTTTTTAPVALTRTNTINPTMTVDNEQEQPASEQSTNLNAKPEDVLQPAREQYASTGRAADYNRPVYNFNQLITPLIKSPPPPLVAPSLTAARAQTTSGMGGADPPQRISNIGHIIYPQAYSQQRQLPNRAEINKLNGKAQFRDRFTPGEAVASAHFKNHHHGHSTGNLSNNKGAAASQIVQQIYKPPTDLYAFPPNTNAQYNSPYQDPKASLPSGNVNSYVAAPSGPIQANSNYPLVDAASNNDPGYKYPGPTNPDASDGKKPLSLSNDDQNVAVNAAGGSAGDADMDNGSDDTIGVLPASAMDDEGKDMGGKGINGKDMDADGSNGGGEGADDAGASMVDDYNHDHPPLFDDTEYPTPPPGWIEEHPDTVHDHHPHTSGDYTELHNDDHFDYHHHHHLPTSPQYVHIYSDHHNHPPLHLPPKLSPVTSEMPPLEPPPEPRVKKYSYFYIGRKLWYIPLYFTVWFSFYVLWLILKSIARHKVNLPNHYVNKRSLPDFGESLEANAKEYINKLTISVLEKIENFERKYIT